MAGDSSQQPFVTPIDLKACRSILVLKLDSIGDFILATPFLRGLRAAAPHARIDLLVAPKTLPLAELCPYVDRVVGLEVSEGPRQQSDGVAAPTFQVEAFGAIASREGLLHDYRNHNYDLAVVPRWDLDMGYGSWLCRGSEAPRRVGFSVPHIYAKFGQYVSNFTDVLHRPFPAHEVEHNASLLSYLKTGEAEARPPDPGPVELWIRQQDLQAADRLLRETGLGASPFIAVCPGAAGANRRMPAGKLLRILRQVERALPSARFLVLGSDFERQTAALLSAGLRHCVEACGRTTLRETVALLSRAAAAVTMDSGPAHMAAAAETPTVVFCPHPRGADPIDNHSPARFRPWGRAESIVLQPEEAVWPCSDRCRGGGPNCIVAIPDEDGAEAIARLAGRSFPTSSAHHRVPPDLQTAVAGEYRSV